MNALRALVTILTAASAWSLYAQPSQPVQDKEYRVAYDLQVLPVNLPGGAFGYLYLPQTGLPSTVFVQMHTSSDSTRSRFADPITRAGYGFLALNSRAFSAAVIEYYALTEDLLLDVKAAMLFLKNPANNAPVQNLPYLPRGQVKKIVLVGQSGGAPLMAYYQAQALNNTVKTYPSGEPVDLSGMPPADGVIMASSHRGRPMVFTQELDASVVSENDMFAVNPALDMFDPANGFRNSQQGLSSDYSQDFYKRYREAQNARNDQLTQIALDTLAYAKTQQAAREAKTGIKFTQPIDPIMVTVRSAIGSADPRTWDLKLDPSDRLLGGGASEGVSALYAPCCGATAWKKLHTARSFLSTASRLKSNEGAEWNASLHSTPLMVLWGTGDAYIFRQDVEDIYAAGQCAVVQPAQQTKEFVVATGLSHGLTPIAPQYDAVFPQVVNHVLNWAKACVENSCVGRGAKRYQVQANGSETEIGPATLTDPMARIVPATPPEKRPCGLY